MNSIIFSENLRFCTFNFERQHYCDNRAGCPRFYIAYMEKGSCRIVTDNTTLHIESGDVFFIPKGLSYQSYWYSDGEIRYKSFAFSFFPENELKRYVLQKIECDTALKEKMKNIPTGISTDSYLISVFYSVVTELLPFMKYEPQSPKKKIVQKTRKFIFENNDCKVHDIAKHCMLSESSLYEVFKKEAGITPNELRQQVLCEKASLLLSSTDKSVQEISDGLGFSSTSYFRKVFKKYTGQTPREIRKNIEKM